MGQGDASPGLRRGTSRNFSPTAVFSPTTVFPHDVVTSSVVVDSAATAASLTSSRIEPPSPGVRASIVKFR